MKLSFAFLRSPRTLAVSLLLLLQAAVLFSFNRPEDVPKMEPLQRYPAQIGDWSLESESALEPEIMANLQPDDYMIRNYVNAKIGLQASLYVAYFKTQRTGHLPHSPKNCLPGSGWVANEAGVISLPVRGAAPIEVNHHRIAHGDNRAVVLYWYQGFNRVVANEYMAKVHLFSDALRYNRTDTALVRVIVPVSESTVAAGETAARDFAQSAYLLMRQWIPQSGARQ